MRQPLILIIGCTASGKAGLGRELAQRMGGEIIAADSMKIYRRMDVGTAKPSIEWRKRVPHHLIDVADPSEDFSVAKFVDLAEAAIQSIQSRRRPAIVVGGTALYFKALTQGLFEGPGANPEVRARLRETAATQGDGVLYERLQRVDAVAAERIHPNDLRRIVRALEVHELTGTPISELQRQWSEERMRYDCRFLGVRRSREDVSGRINARVKRMVEAGLVEEVSSLLAGPAPLSRTARQAVGYAEIIRHLQGEVSLADAVELIKINTRQLAKGQRTWFKRFRDTEWIDVGSDDSAESVADNLLHRDVLWKA